jgi:hypothetical protein
MTDFSVISARRSGGWKFVSVRLDNWEQPTHNDGIEPWRSGTAPFVNGSLPAEFGNGTGIPLQTLSFFRKLVAYNASELLNCSFGLASERAAVVFVNGLVVSNDTAGANATYFNKNVPVTLANGPNLFAAQLRAGSLAQGRAAFDLEVVCSKLPPPKRLPSGKNEYVARRTQVTGGVVECKCIKPDSPAVLRVALRDGAGAPAGLPSSTSPFEILARDANGTVPVAIVSANFSGDGTAIDFLISVNVTSAMLNISVVDNVQGGFIAPSPLIVVASAAAVVPTLAPLTMMPATGGGGGGGGNDTDDATANTMALGTSVTTIVPGFDDLYLFIAIGGVVFCCCCVVLCLVMLMVTKRKKRSRPRKDPLDHLSKSKKLSKAASNKKIDALLGTTTAAASNDYFSDARVDDRLEEARPVGMDEVGAAMLTPRSHDGASFALAPGNGGSIAASVVSGGPRVGESSFYAELPVPASDRDATSMPGSAYVQMPMDAQRGGGSFIDVDALQLLEQQQHHQQQDEQQGQQQQQHHHHHEFAQQHEPVVETYGAPVQDVEIVWEE